MSSLLGILTAWIEYLLKPFKPDFIIRPSILAYPNTAVLEYFKLMFLTPLAFEDNPILKDPAIS